jgi:hypothetical protein
MPPPSTPMQNDPAGPPSRGFGHRASILILVGIFGALALFQNANPPVMPPEAVLASRFNDSVRGSGLMDETGAAIGPVPDAVHETTLCRVTQNGLRLWSDPMAYICLARGRSDAGPVFLLHEFRKIHLVGDVTRVEWTGTSYHPWDWSDLMARHDLHPADLPTLGTDPTP